MPPNSAHRLGWEAGGCHGQDLFVKGGDGYFRTGSSVEGPTIGLEKHMNGHPSVAEKMLNGTAWQPIGFGRRNLTFMVGWAPKPSKHPRQRALVQDRVAVSGEFNNRVQRDGFHSTLARGRKALGFVRTPAGGTERTRLAIHPLRSAHHGSQFHQGLIPVAWTFMSQR